MTEFETYLNELDKSKVGEYLLFVSKLLDTQIDLSVVLDYFGIDVSTYSKEEQIPCLLPQHGTHDNKNSARYYRDSDTNFSRIHCFKCQKTLSGFWYFYTIQKDSDLKAFQILKNYVKIFEPEITSEFFDFEKGQNEKDEIIEKPLEEVIQYYHSLKRRNIDQFKEEFVILLKESLHIN